MTTTDDTIRELVATRVRSAPAAMTPTELVDRWQRKRVQPAPQRRTTPAPGRALAMACATVLVLVVGLWAITRRDTGPAPASPVTPVVGVEVGAYFLPGDLPDSFRMLAVHEHAGDPRRIDPAIAVYADADGNRIELRRGDLGEQEPAWAFTEAVDGATAHWNASLASPGGRWREFEVELDGGQRAVGTMRGVDDARVAAVLSGVRPATGDAAPTLDAIGWTLVTAAEAGANPIVAESTAYWGPPGGYLGADSLRVTVRRFRAAIDIDARVGVWSQSQAVGDRTTHGAQFGILQTWYPRPDIEVEVQGTGTVDGGTALESLVEVDETAFAAAVAEIPAGLDLAPVIGEDLVFDSGVRASFVGGVDDARGVCLEVDGQRGCDLATMDRSGYTEDNQIVFFDTDVLIAGRWFSVGARWERPDASFAPPAPQGAETITLDDPARSYYLIERPADAESVVDAFDTPTFRPAR